MESVDGPVSISAPLVTSGMRSCGSLLLWQTTAVNVRTDTKQIDSCRDSHHSSLSQLSLSFDNVSSVKVKGIPFPRVS